MGLLGFFLIACISLGTGQDLLFRAGSRVPGKYWICIISGCAVYVLSQFFWFGALKVVPLVVASPLMASTYVPIALFSALLFKERADQTRWLAIILVTISAAMFISHHP